MKPIRFSKNNGSIHIGGRHNKLTLFTREKSARLHIGKHTFHVGKAWG